MKRKGKGKGKGKERHMERKWKGKDMERERERKGNGNGKEMERKLPPGGQGPASMCHLSVCVCARVSQRYSENNPEQKIFPGMCHLSVSVYVCVCIQGVPHKIIYIYISICTYLKKRVYL